MKIINRRREMKRLMKVDKARAGQKDQILSGRKQAVRHFDARVSGSVLNNSAWLGRKRGTRHQMYTNLIWPRHARTEPRGHCHMPWACLVVVSLTNA